MKKIVTRTITGLVYIALLLIAVLCGQYAFVAIFGLILLLGLYEIEKLFTGGRPAILLYAIDAIASIALFCISFVCLSKGCGDTALISIASTYLFVRESAQLYIKSESAVKSLSTSLSSITMLVVPFMLMNRLYLDVNGDTTLLACLIFIWVNDTGAYCVGTMFGRHRLFERISPKKSWEGFFGGLAFTIVAALIIGTYFSNYFQGFTAIQWVGLAVAVTIFATLGDLAESLIKRNAGVKDSGNILPGHGGILDRIDSLLLVIPGAVLYSLLIAGF